MGRQFKISILFSIFAIVNGYDLVHDLKDRQKSADQALDYMKIGLQEFSKGIEKMVMKRLEGVENIVDENIKQMIGNATRNIEDQSTDQSEKISEKLLSALVDKKISDLLFTTQIEQRLFRQEMVSVTSILFGKLEKISDVISVTQTEQRLFNEEIKFLSTNLSERIDQKISDLITTTQTEQRHLGQKFDYFMTNLTKDVEEKIIDVHSTTHTEQQVFNKNIESLLYNFSANVDNKISNKLSAIQTEQQTLKQDLFSRTDYLVGKVDDIRNTSMYLAEQLFSGEAIDMLRNVEVIRQYLLKAHDMAGTDCADILKKYPNTRWNNGVYNITVSPIKFKAVYCDMTTDNGGWTVIQQRVNGSVDFYRNWTEYKNGFGYADHEYWIGNDMLHRLTSLKPQELRVDMERFNGEKGYAVYSRFSVGDEASKYKLEVQWGYSGNAGNSLDYHNNMTFSTPDQDNDGYSGNCANYYRSGWWFDSCYYANPNGQYTDSEKNGTKYIVWHHWENSYMSLKAIQLMIRPRA